MLNSLQIWAESVDHADGRCDLPFHGRADDRILKEQETDVLKRGMVGVYQHCGEAQLHRYLAESDFRYSRRTALKISDAERAEDLLRSARDERLTYRRIGEAGYA